MIKEKILELVSSAMGSKSIQCALPFWNSLKSCLSLIHEKFLGSSSFFVLINILICRN